MLKRKYLLTLGKSYPNVSEEYQKNKRKLRGHLADKNISPLVLRLGKTEPAPVGRVPDATKGADHLRQVFGHRLGLSDQIVSLFPVITLWECYKGSIWILWVVWTNYNQLIFDNSYYTFPNA